MTSPREIDTRKTDRKLRAAVKSVHRESFAASRSNIVTASPATVHPIEGVGIDGSTLIDKALSFVSIQRESFGLGPRQVGEFVPDPVVQRTSSGSASVHLHQRFRGLPIFQMARAVRFDTQSQIVDAVGDTAVVPDGFNVAPRLPAGDAVLKAAQHVSTAGGTYTTQFSKEILPLPTVDIREFRPTVVASFPLPGQPTVFDKGPFECLIPVNLILFVEPEGPRLAWQVVLTFPNYEDGYVVLVSADERPGEILFCKGTVHRALAIGNVYETNPVEGQNIRPGTDGRRLINFPRPLNDYPAMPTTPLVGFPTHWVENNQTFGNCTRATLNFGTQTLTGADNSPVIFNPQDPSGDDQKLLNIFYFCNYMHDFLYILGFDEAAGNFQQVNFTHLGIGGDPVRARAHSGPVNGTANMSTPPDGQSPVMNMGLVSASNRHTAFDADVVFHEYTHGLTNRLVGGPMNTQSLDKLQSSGMGEGWSDFFAVTIQNFFRLQEKFVVGDWVVNNPAGIRRKPYDDNFPFGFGDLHSFSIDPQTGQQEVHEIGELWCAILLRMTRRIRTALGNDQSGYRLAWQIVVDGLKLTPANPTFIETRDAILRALDDLKKTNRITADVHKLVRRASWEAFAHLGLGTGAAATDADTVEAGDITADDKLPADL